MRLLTQAGMTDARLDEEGRRGCIITVQSDYAMLQDRAHSMHIIASRQDTRLKIRDLLMNRTSDSHLCIHHSPMCSLLMPTPNSDSHVCLSHVSPLTHVFTTHTNAQK